jgi:hypothetical protein
MLKGKKSPSTFVGIASGMSTARSKTSRAAARRTPTSRAPRGSSKVNKMRVMVYASSVIKIKDAVREVGRKLAKRCQY